jgi:pimeloyl-ACP methyl ester carboxylesterase
MPTRILMASQLSAAVMDVAREILPPGYELVVADFDSAEFAAGLKDAEYYIGSPRFQLGPEFYPAAPRLKLVQLFSAGYDRLDIEAARQARVPICNNGGSNSVAVAEHALLLMLAVSRRLVWQHENVVAGRWRGNDFSSIMLYELEDKILGIVGLGNIGKKVARLAQAFRMRVQYYDVARPRPDPGARLLIHGRYDQMVAFEVSIAILNHIAGSRLVLLNSCGHWQPFEKPAEWAAQVLALLRGHKEERLGSNPIGPLIPIRGDFAVCEPRFSPPATIASAFPASNSSRSGVVVLSLLRM